MATKKKTTRMKMKGNPGAWGLFFHALDQDEQGRTRYAAAITTKVHGEPAHARVYLFETDIPTRPGRMPYDGGYRENGYTVWTFCVVAASGDLSLPAGLFHIQDRDTAIDVATKVVRRGFE